jgi:hypothetical protein
MNLTEYLATRGNTINGKTLRKPDLNLVAKLDKMGVTASATELVLTRNPVSRHAELLNPFLSALVNWTFAVYASYDMDAGSMKYGNTKVAIGTYDRVRMLVLSLDGNVYGSFLD